MHYSGDALVVARQTELLTYICSLHANSALKDPCHNSPSFPSIFGIQNTLITSQPPADNFPADGDASEEDQPAQKKKKGKRKRTENSDIVVTISQREYEMTKAAAARKVNQYTSGRPVNSPYFAPEAYKVSTVEVGLNCCLPSQCL